MGWASYTERISEIQSELLGLNAIVTMRSGSLADANARFASLANSCGKLIHLMDCLVELATDPEVSLAHEFAEV